MLYSCSRSTYKIQSLVIGKYMVIMLLTPKDILSWNTVYHIVIGYNARLVRIQIHLRLKPNNNIHVSEAPSYCGQPLANTVAYISTIEHISMSFYEIVSLLVATKWTLYGRIPYNQQTTITVQGITHHYLHYISPCLITGCITITKLKMHIMESSSMQKWFNAKFPKVRWWK